MFYSGQQKKRYKIKKNKNYVKTKTIVYHHLHQCLRETCLSSQSKQSHPVPLRKNSGKSIFRPMIELAMIEFGI